MNITHLGHAAVLVETGDARILIDPGNMEAGWQDLVDLDAILVTHQHADHLDPEQVPALIKANPGAALVVEPSILDLAGTEVAGVGRVPELPGARVLAPDDKIAIGSVTITAAGGQHAIIHRDIPRVGNVGFLLSAEGEPTLFHPGDSYEYAPQGVDILAYPSFGPWGALKEGIDFARAVGAGRGFPIHDALLSETGRAMMVGRISAMTPTQLTDLRGAGATSY
ncbi:MBL fold metallo-hydrolase [Microlunatus endophyticus]|uniref:MBL fold metallo-hydrolase n=1 Tax=Microlunatus endophyticus TaxID=1716077 RepID=A0A917SE66_9ACTN|nr:MBL fold metallo-hydrolase [Microlunatus endophyticus]GGL75817.1 MBL fold metallo-hydrolase [Microlunatus endophyticus]